MSKRLDQALQDKHACQYASTYGEPGYTDPEKGILFANCRFECYVLKGE